MTNKEKIEYILEQIIKAKYTPHDIKYGNGYFVFKFGEDTVCHFKIQGIRGWRFGIWVNVNQDKPGEFATIFAQYENEIDKFKPSHSYYCVTMEQREVSNNSYHLIHMIDEIKKYPFVAYYHNATNIKWHISTLEAFWFFIKHRYTNTFLNIQNCVKNIYEYLSVWSRLIYAKIVRDKICDFKIIDKNQAERRHWSRYRIEISLNRNDYSDEELLRWEDKYFKKPMKNFDRLVQYMEEE